MATIFAPALGDMLQVFLEAENLAYLHKSYLYQASSGKINQPSFGAACCLSYIRVSGDRTRQKRNTNAFYHQG